MLSNLVYKVLSRAYDNLAITKLCDVIKNILGMVPENAW